MAAHSQRVRVVILFFLIIQASLGWNVDPKRPDPKQWQKQAVKFVFAAMITLVAPTGDLLHLPWHASPAIAVQTPLSMDEEQLRKSLKPATEDRPQIMLPTEATGLQADKQPIVEGLLSLSNPQRRPGPTDTIVITIRSVEKPDVVLGGARIPVSKARFPVAFRMFQKNIIKDQLDAWQGAKEGDLLVQAVVCPEEMPRCTVEDGGQMQTQGVAKMIRNLPGQTKDEIIRGPVALQLQ